MDYILFDTETTGLVKSSLIPLDRQPRLIEIFALRLRLDAEGEWQEAGELDLLVNPGIKITPEITNITGISQDMVKDAPPTAQAWPSVMEFFEGADAMVAHNLTYDRSILTFEHARHGTGSFPFPKRQICTVEHTTHMHGYRLKLADLHLQLTGKPLEGAHRARNDVMATSRVFRELWSRDEI